VGKGREQQAAGWKEAAGCKQGAVLGEASTVNCCNFALLHCFRSAAHAAAAAAGTAGILASPDANKRWTYFHMHFLTLLVHAYFTLHAPPNKEWEPQPGANARLIGRRRILEDIVIIRKKQKKQQKGMLHMKSIFLDPSAALAAPLLLG
jgi:hypothetical protein